MAGVYKSIFTGPEIDAKLSERVPSTPSGSPLHDLFVAAGAVWNPSSKSWTGGSVTGISNSVMTRIYSLSHNVLNNSNWDSALYSTDIPVNLPPRKAPNQFTNEINVTASSTFTSRLYTYVRNRRLCGFQIVLIYFTDVSSWSRSLEE